MIDTILFDLDGTLLQMDEKHFVDIYFNDMKKVFIQLEMDPEASMKAFLAATQAMILNDGSQTNEDAFWNQFTSLTKINRQQIEAALQNYYEKDFIRTKESTGFYPEMQETLNLLKEKGYRLILATNPIFPQIATMQRVAWAKLNPESFEDITTFENYHFCKPNVKYFQEILDKFNLKPQQCLMVGNDVQEDLVIAGLGAKTFLVKNNLIDRDSLKNYLCDYQGEMKDFIDFVKNDLPSLN